MSPSFPSVRSRWVESPPPERALDLKGRVRVTDDQGARVAIGCAVAENPDRDGRREGRRTRSGCQPRWMVKTVLPRIDLAPSEVGVGSHAHVRFGLLLRALARGAPA